MIYDYQITTGKGETLNLADYKGKVIMVVNTATGCGFTPQYAPIEQMYRDYHDQGLEIFDIPCNQFGGQAPGTDDEIHEFCTMHFNTTFPQMKKADVNGENELPLYTYLKSQKGFEGFDEHPYKALLEKMFSDADPDWDKKPDIKWNFTKFIIDREGNVVARFEPTANMADVEACVKALLQKNTPMVIKAVKFRKDGFYSQPFAFGGEEGPAKFDPNIRYRGSLQNYLIDTGDEVILVDTGLPAGTPEEVPDETSPAYTGKDICSYMEAFTALGYKPEQVTAILLTHRHSDHSGELRSFPNAKIYVNEDELSAAELQGIENIVPVSFTDGAYYNFPESQKIRDGITLIKAKGHTNGNSIIIVENEGLFYMIHGDITYVDEALYEDKLSVVFDDLPAARVTQDRIREFIRNHPTVYCGTHTPQGYENLEAKRVMDLDNPVETVLAEVDFTKQQASGKYVCSICGYVYDPAEHDGVAFEDLPEDWVCPRCRKSKDKFNKA